MLFLTRRHSRAKTAMAASLLVIAISGCRLEFIQVEDPHMGAGAGVNNGTSVPLRIEAFGDGEWLWIGNVEANTDGSVSARNWWSEFSRYARDGCTTGPVRAVDGSGGWFDETREVVALRDEPLCDGDTWVIEAVET